MLAEKVLVLAVIRNKYAATSKEDKEYLKIEFVPICASSKGDTFDMEIPCTMLRCSNDKFKVLSLEDKVIPNNVVIMELEYCIKDTTSYIKEDEELLHKHTGYELVRLNEAIEFDIETIESEILTSNKKDILLKYIEKRDRIRFQKQILSAMSK